MSSGSQDNSITGSGISIPNWMKQKIGDRYDLDDSAFSPPSQDDSFFCIRYPKTLTRRPSESNYHRINQYLEGQSSTAAIATVPDSDTSTSANAGVSSNLTGQKSSQLMTAPKLSLEFDPDEPPPNLAHRRGSKSLPASPLSTPNTSPRFSRKNMSILQNRYFTAAFANPKDSKSETDQGYSGWLMGGLLKSREHIPDTLAPISEGSLTVPSGENQSLKKSASAAALRKMGEEDSPPKLKEHHKKAIKPKPSELREMNFWSPTSM